MSNGSGRREETAAVDANLTQSLRGLAGEVTEQLSRFGNNVDNLTRIMIQAGFMPTQIDSIEKADNKQDELRDPSITSVIRDANTSARMSNNRIEELLATLERELL